MCQDTLSNYDLLLVLETETLKRGKVCFSIAALSYPEIALLHANHTFCNNFLSK
jgi:hypothetical protein